MKRSLERHSCAGRPASRQGCRSLWPWWRHARLSSSTEASQEIASASLSAQSPHDSRRAGRSDAAPGHRGGQRPLPFSSDVRGVSARREPAVSLDIACDADGAWPSWLSSSRRRFGRVTHNGAAPQSRHSWQAHAFMAVDVVGVDREHRCDRPGDGEPLACERLAPHTLGPRVRPAGRDLLARSWRMANGWQTGWAVRNTGVSGRG